MEDREWTFAKHGSTTEIPRVWIAADESLGHSSAKKKVGTLLLLCWWALWKHADVDEFREEIVRPLYHNNTINGSLMDYRVCRKKNAPPTGYWDILSTNTSILLHTPFKYTLSSNADGTSSSSPAAPTAFATFAGTLTISRTQSSHDKSFFKRRYLHPSGSRETFPQIQQSKVNPSDSLKLEYIFVRSQEWADNGSMLYLQNTGGRTSNGAVNSE